MRRVFAVVLIAILISILSGCGWRYSDDIDDLPGIGANNGNRPNPTLEYSGSLKPETYVQQGNSTVTFPAGSDPVVGTANIAIAMPAGESSKIAVNSILVGYTEKGGFIRRVTGVTDTQSDGAVATLTLTTEPALLSDAFSEIKVVYGGLLSQAVSASRRLLESSGETGNGNTAIKAAILTTIVNDSCRAAKTDIPFNGGNIGVEATVNFDPDVDFEFDYSVADGLKVFRLIFTGNLDGTVQITGTCEAGFEKTWEKELIHWETPFIAGPVAGSIEIAVPVGFTVAASAEGKVLVGEEFGYQLRIGAIYNPESGWKYLNEKSSTKSQRLFEYEIGGSASAETYLGVSAAVKLLGVVGPKAELKAFVNMAAEWANQAMWDMNGSINAGLSASVALILKVWVVTLGEWEYDLFTYQTPLWEDKIPFTAKITGKLIDDADSSPLSSVAISVQRGDGEIFETTTGSDGWYALDVEPGISVVTCKKAGFDDLIWETVQVEPYMVFSYPFSEYVNYLTDQKMKKSTVSIKGIILDKTAVPNPAPISGARISIKQNGSEITAITTDASGRFSWACPNPGVYDLEVSHEKFEPRSINHTANFGDTTDLQIEMQILKGSLSGVITEKLSGKSLSGATVTLKIGETTMTSATSDDEGKYILENLEARTYSVVVSLEGYSPTVIDSLSVVPGEQKKQDVKLSNSEALFGRYLRDVNGIITDLETNLQWIETFEEDTWQEHHDRVSRMGGGWRQADGMELRVFWLGLKGIEGVYQGNEITTIVESWTSNLYPYPDHPFYEIYREKADLFDRNWRNKDVPIKGNLACRLISNN